MERDLGACGSHSYCQEDNSGATSCVCDAGFENWAGYTQGCSLIDPCKDVDCEGTFENSQCYVHNNEGMYLITYVNFLLWIPKFFTLRVELSISLKLAK